MEDSAPWCPRLEIRLNGARRSLALAHFPEPAFRSLIQAAIKHSISYYNDTPTPIPGTLYIDVTVNDTSSGRSSSGDDPQASGLPNEPTRLAADVFGDRETLALDHNFKLLIEYEMAFHDLKICCVNLNQRTAVRKMVPTDVFQDPDSARYDPVTRNLLLARFLAHYVRLKLRSLTWLSEGNPTDVGFDFGGAWKHMKEVVDNGSLGALQSLHEMLAPGLTKYLGLP